MNVDCDSKNVTCQLSISILLASDSLLQFIITHNGINEVLWQLIYPLCLPTESSAYDNNGRPSRLSLPPHKRKVMGSIHGGRHQKFATTVWTVSTKNVQTFSLQVSLCVDTSKTIFYLRLY